MRMLVCLALAAILIVSSAIVSGDATRKTKTYGCTPMVLPVYPYSQPVFTEDYDGKTVTVYPGTMIHLRVGKLVVPAEPHVYYPTRGFWLAGRHFYPYNGEVCAGFAGVKQWDLVARQPGIYRISVINDPAQGGEGYPMMNLTVYVRPY